MSKLANECSRIQEQLAAKWLTKKYGVQCEITDPFSLADRLGVDIIATKDGKSYDIQIKQCRYTAEKFASNISHWDIAVLVCDENGNNWYDAVPEFAREV
jgi:hypothetical protein